MSEQPERPAQPGVETHLVKEVVAAAQAALDETFNDLGGASRDQVEEHLREQLERRGALGTVPTGWVDRAADSIAAGNPRRGGAGRGRPLNHLLRVQPNA